MSDSNLNAFSLNALSLLNLIASQRGYLQLLTLLHKALFIFVHYSFCQFRGVRSPQARPHTSHVGISICRTVLGMRLEFLVTFLLPCLSALFGACFLTLLV